MKQIKFFLDSKKNEEAIDKAVDGVYGKLQELPPGKYEVVIRKPVRTQPQHSSSWLFCEWISDALNEAGYHFGPKFFKRDFELEWTAQRVRDSIWHVVMETLTGKKNSKDLTTSEHTKVADAIQKALSKGYGVSVSYPNEADRQRGIKPYEVF